MQIRPNDIQNREFTDLREAYSIEAAAVFGYNSFSSELSNRILLKLLNNSRQIDAETRAVGHILRTEADNYLKELQMYCYKFALKLTSEPELASDITQDSIVELFKNIDQVEFIKGWLTSTVYNKTMIAIKDKINFGLLFSELELQQAQYHDLSNLAESTLIKTMPEDQLKELLAEKDYLMYIVIKKYHSLKEYSIAEEISYGTAKKHSHIIRRNLKAAYLRKLGWQAKPEILTYKQYDNLRRFVQRLLKFSQNNEINRLKRYCSKIDHHQVKKVLAQITTINDWGVKYLGAHDYYLTLWDKDNWQIIVLMTISVPPDKSISILTCKSVKCMKKMKNKFNKKIPLEKGLITLKFEELVKYMSKP